MTLKPDSMVESVLYDMQQDRVTGVRVINAENGEIVEYKAKVVFLCASTLGTAHLLLNSANERFSGGLANSSGQLGRNLMDHQMGGATCTMEGWEDSYYFGGRPNGIYIPRFRNVKEKHPDFIRGYGYQGRAARIGWEAGAAQPGFGAEFKNSLTKPGLWNFGLSGFGETLPDPNNKVTLNKNKTDKFGLPVNRAVRNIDVKEVDLVVVGADPPIGADQQGGVVKPAGVRRAGRDAAKEQVDAQLRRCFAHKTDNRRGVAARKFLCYLKFVL